MRNNGITRANRIFGHYLGQSIQLTKEAIFSYFQKILIIIAGFYNWQRIFIGFENFHPMYKI